MIQNPIKTLVVDNFRGPMTIYNYGDINSGHGYEQVNSGGNPFLKPGQLTWCDDAVQIDSGASVITDLIMAGKERVESGILYVYCIGHTGRLYKIQVNDPTTYNSDYDNPTLLATLTINTPTFTKGGSIDFFGATEKIYIGSDIGLTSINFDGTGEAFVGVLGSWTQSVARPLRQFLGKLYIGNGTNIAEVDSTATVTSYTKLSPGFPTSAITKDLDLDPAGNYLDILTSTLPTPNLTVTTQDTTSTANAGSTIFKWNGTDTGYTSSISFPSYALTANILFQNYQYTFGTDQFGSAIYAPYEKIITIPEAPAALPNAVFSTGNMVGIITPIYYQSMLQSYCLMWGSNDFEVGHPYGHWSPFFRVAVAPETDIIQVPFVLPVSNTGFGSTYNGYTNNVFGTSKLYFSQLEASSTPTTAYRLYKWKINTSGLQSPVSTNAIIDGIYQTQTQLFSQKVKLSEVRVYGEPWVSGNSFLIDIVGSDGLPISGASKTFTAGSNLTIGDDFAWYTPAAAPTYAIGLAVSNKGSTNHTITKVEIDYSFGGR